MPGRRLEDGFPADRVIKPSGGIAMGEVYKMNIAGCERELPICPLNEHMDIAGFVMFSDVEIT